MLIEFSVANYRCIRERQTLSMAATPSSELRDTNVIPAPIKGLPGLVRSAALYGPNAAGKSTLVQALRFMKEFVTDSARNWKKGKKINVAPFLLDSESASQPSEFEAYFIIHADPIHDQKPVRYQYGFSVDKTRVLSEYLYAYPNRRPQLWFNRSWVKNGYYEWSFGDNFKGNRNVWKDATHETTSFLSMATQLNCTQLESVFNWFDDTLRVIKDGIFHEYTVNRMINDTQEKTTKSSVLAFLKAADIGVSDINIVEEPFDKTAIPDAIARLLGDEFKYPEQVYSVEFCHQSHSDTDIKFDLDAESDGTQKLFGLAGPWLDIMQENIVAIFDELNNSLHPSIMHFLVSLVNRPESGNSQLLFTTHDATALDPELLRRDQIWFIEKDQGGAAHLYPLTDFKPRKNEALAKGYLEGRYGALPFIGELHFP